VQELACPAAPSPIVISDLGSAVQGDLKCSQQLAQAAQFFFRKRAEFPGTVLENKDPECPSHPRHHYRC